LLSRGAERLAREARSDRIHSATPRLSVEVPQVAEDGGVVEDSVSDAAPDVPLAPFVPFDVADGSVSADEIFEGERESAKPGT